MSDKGIPPELQRLLKDNKKTPLDDDKALPDYVIPKDSTLDVVVGSRMQIYAKPSKSDPVNCIKQM